MFAWFANNWNMFYQWASAQPVFIQVAIGVALALVVCFFLLTVIRPILHSTALD